MNYYFRSLPQGLSFMLWAVDGTSLHLLGSIHISDQARSALFPEAKVIYRAAERVTFEQDLAQPQAVSAMENEPGTLLSQRVPEAIFTCAIREWEKIGLDPQRLEQLQPWAAVMCILLNRAAKSGLQNTYGVDQQVWQQARQDGKACRFLELPNEALRCFRNGPLSEQTLWLKHIVDSPETEDRELADLIDAWHRHDDRSMERLLANRLLLLPVTFGNLITRRNHSWMPKLLKQAAEPVSTLVIVGALHCVGKMGLPELFNRAGIRLSRII